MWIKRDLEACLTTAAAVRPGLVLTGCRQAGKTSLLQRVFPDCRYVSLDLPETSELAEMAGGSFLRENPPPVILDEVQYAPSLLRHVKAAIDKSRQKNGQFFITGSHRFNLMGGVAESLAGRVAVLECHTLSALEVERHRGEAIGGELLVDVIYRGGYPELQVADLDPQRFFSDYIATYLERDVRSALEVRSLRDFQRFMRLAALRTGQLLNMASLAADVRVSVPTISSWLSVLESSGIVQLVPPFFSNASKRLIKTPKLFFLDTGLACFLCGLRKGQELRESAMRGQMFETHVLGQIMRWYANRGLHAPVHFFQDHARHEVDFVIPVGQRLKLYECKWAEMPEQDTPGLQAIRKLVGAENILTTSIITPTRGHWRNERTGVIIEDSIELASLAE